MKHLLFPFFCLFGVLPLCACAATNAPTILVPKIEGLSDSFLMGADVSSLLSLENSGAAFYGFDGKEQDAIKTLREAGVNCIRIRVWNDPYDVAGRGYGGGNCDLNAAIKLGLRAKEYGMQVLIDFHYSDFWADPGKQFVPKAWADMHFAQKEQAIYDYTVESLAALLEAGVPVIMVQIGNEINNGICGETSVPRVCSLLSAAARAVRDTDDSIKIAVHYTNPENGRYSLYAANLKAQGVDYDVFASSYYPFWHGTLENLIGQLQNIAQKHGKQVMIAETAWAYTANDSDGHGNTVGTEPTYAKIYPLTVQGQARQLSDVIGAMASLGDAAIGVFYWEPAWITVPASTPEERQMKWETYGSGWASSFAGEYDSNDAGLYYGGSACDNQALFDATGHPLESMKTFSYVRTGTDVAPRVDSIEHASVTIQQGEPILLPETVTAVYNTGEAMPVSVTWNADADLAAIAASPAGLYTVQGIADGQKVLCYIHIAERNLLANYSFEEADTSMWQVTENISTGQTKFQNKAADAHSGDIAFHFWHANAVDFTLEQTVDNLAAGSYHISVHVQGGDIGTDAELVLYAVSDGVRYEQPFTLTGWRNWQTPTIENIPCENGSMTVGVSVKAQGNAWGTIDDFLLKPT